jgi:hypothetical protein
MAINVILAPDVFVNASVAQGSTPEQVVQRVLGRHKGETQTTRWVLERVEQMLKTVPEFKNDAIKPQLETILGHVQVIDDPGQFGDDEWERAMTAIAKAAGAERVVTDHPDLLQKESSGGIEFISSDAWLVEQTTPPPHPE